MLNQVIICGRITSSPTIEETDGKKKTILTIATPRSYKNIDGNYETDFIPCVLWNVIAENTCEYCKKGDIVGVKGRIQTTKKLNFDNSTSYEIEIIAEKISFLSSKKEE